MVGNRLVPVDGSPSHDVALIALALDPPLAEQSRTAQREDFVALTDQLASETGFGHAPDEGWQILDRAEIASHPDYGFQIHP